MQGFRDAAAVGVAAGVKTWAGPGPFIFTLLTVVLFFMAALGILVLVVGGVMYITSFGDEDKARRAKQVVLYALTGLAIIMLAGVMVNFVILLFR